MNFRILILASALIFNAVLIAEEVKPIHLSQQDFKEKVFDYENNNEWNYLGDIPAIIDFYADWCAPCRQVAPIMDDLAKEYEGRVIIYKVDTEVERELAGMFGIRSIPSILFIPTQGQPTMVSGAYPKAEMVRIIKEVLKVE